MLTIYFSSRKGIVFLLVTFWFYKRALKAGCIEEGTYKNLVESFSKFVYHFQSKIYLFIHLLGYWRYLRLKAATVTIQKYWKGWAQRRRYQKMKVGYMRLQALIRSRVLSHRFRHLRGHIVGLQAHARGYLVRKMINTKRQAIIRIQAHVRRVIAQRKFNKIKVSWRIPRLVWIFRFMHFV